MKRILIASLLFLFVAAVAVAQGPPPKGPGGPPHPPGKWWKSSEVVKELDLSDAQIKQVEQTFLDYRLKLIDLHAEVERQEAKLQPLIEADRPDEQQVGAQVDAVLSARARLEKTNTMMMLAIRRALSVEQWKKLQAIQEKREGPFFRHFEGPMPPGAHTEKDVIFYRRVPGGPDSPPPPPPSGPGENE